MQLYKIAAELTQAIELYNQVETDEDLLKVEQMLNDITLTLKDKAVAVGHHIIDIRGDIEKVGQEIGRLVVIRDRLKKSEEWLEGYLHNNMEAVGETKIESPTLKLTIKNNPASVNILDESRIPETYIVSKVVKSIDKKAIKASWDAGVGVEGTEVIRKTRLEIK
jgi:hypothetical protein